MNSETTFYANGVKVTIKETEPLRYCISATHPRLSTNPQAHVTGFPRAQRTALALYEELSELV